MSKAIQLPSYIDKKELATQLGSDLDNSRGDASAIMSSVRDGREMFENSQPIIDKFDGQCELVYPYLKTIKQALIAHHGPLLLGSDPIIKVLGVGRDAKEVAGYNEALIQQQLLRAEIATVGETLINLALRDKVGFAYVIWSEQYRMRRVFDETTEIQMSEQGYQVEVPKRVISEPRELLSFYGPKIIPIEIDRAGAFPACATDFQSSPGAWVAYDEYGSTLLEKAVAEDYDMEAVKYLQDGYNGTTKRISSDAALRNMSSSAPATAMFHSTSYDLTDVYWRLPKSKDGKRTEDYLITLHEPSNTILHAEPTPWMHGRRPIVPIRAFGDGLTIYGDSLADLVGWVQEWLQTIWRMNIDGYAFHMDPEIYLDSSLTETERNTIMTKRGPGKAVPVRPDALKTMTPGIHGQPPDYLMPMTELLKKEGGTIGSMNETMQGGLSGGNKTALEINQASAYGQKGLNLQAEHLAVGFKQIGDLCLELNYQFHGHPELAKQFGEANPDAVIDIYDAVKLVPHRQFTVLASGVTEEANQALVQQKSDQLLALLFNPDLPFAQVIMQDGNLVYQILSDNVRSKKVNEPDSKTGTKEQYVSTFGTFEENQQKKQQAQGQPQGPPPVPLDSSQQAMNQSKAELTTAQVETEKAKTVQIFHDMMLTSGSQQQQELAQIEQQRLAALDQQQAGQQAQVDTALKANAQQHGQMMSQQQAALSQQQAQEQQEQAQQTQNAQPTKPEGKSNG